MDRNKTEDLRKLAVAVIDRIEFHGSCEYGSIGLDCKRPFGNSDVEGDILEIIGWEMEGDDGYDDVYSSGQRVYANELYTEKLAKFISSHAIIKI